MKKHLSFLVAAVVLLGATSCSTVGTLPTDKLQTMYERRVEKTSFLNKLFFNDHKKKKVIYEKIGVFMDENSVERPFVTVAYGSYTPYIIPLLRPEKKSLEHNLLYKAAYTANKMKADAVIIDNKNNFRVIKYTN